MKEIRFVSLLAPLCIQFVEYKHAIGQDYHKEALYLRVFDSFCYKYYPEISALTKEVVLAWTAHQAHERQNNQLLRISIIRQFGKYLDSKGHEAFIHPPCYNMTEQKYMPYVFSKDEMKRIFHYVDHLEKRGISPYYHITTPVIIKTLYGCGLRITEALSLQMKDINMRTGIITILNSKYGKDRVVPMSESLYLIYQKYIESHRYYATENDFLFPDHLTAHGFYYRFREMLRHVGISHRGRGKGPRVHDLRHTFAVHCLNRWVNEGQDVYTILPILSTYLGHSSISATSDYLRLTASSFQDFLTVAEKNHPLLNRRENETDEV